MHSFIFFSFTLLVLSRLPPPLTPGQMLSRAQNPTWPPSPAHPAKQNVFLFPNSGSHAQARSFYNMIQTYFYQGRRRKLRLRSLLHSPKPSLSREARSPGSACLGEAHVCPPCFPFPDLHLHSRSRYQLSLFFPWAPRRRGFREGGITEEGASEGKRDGGRRKVEDGGSSRRFVYSRPKRKKKTRETRQ